MPDTFRSLRNRNYRLFFIGQQLSVVGTWMQTIALGWLTLRLGGDRGVAVGVLLAVQYLPMLLLGVWGGVVADRFDRRRTLVVTQTAFAVVASVQAAVTITDVVQLWMVYGLALLQGLVNAVDVPARQSFPTELVSTEELPNAMALNSAQFNSARVIGPALAGPLIVAVGTGWCLALNAVSYVSVIAMLASMKPADLRPAKKSGRRRGQAVEGLRYVRNEPGLLSVLVLSTVIGMMAINYPVSLPVIARVVFDGDARTYSSMTTAMGVGALVGALVAAGRTRPTARRIMLASLALGTAMSAAAASPSLLVMFPFLAAMGFAHTTMLSNVQSKLQLDAAPEMRGRVAALRAITVQGTTPIGAPLVGWIAGISPRWGLGVGGLSAIAAALGYGAFLARGPRPSGPGAPASQATASPTGGR